MFKEKRSAINGTISRLTRVSCVEWHTILPRGISSDSVVLDLGANHGRFSDKMRKHFGSFCHAIEASPVPWKELDESKDYKACNYALTDKNGTLSFNTKSTLSLVAVFHH